MKAASSRSLKPLYLKWLVGLAALDTIVILLFIAPELVAVVDWTKLAVQRALGALVVPVVVLLLTGWLSAEVKAMLIFWKIIDPLPGSAAFSKHGPADKRINMATLKRHVGAFPTSPADQNAKWYKLYGMVQNEPAVVEAHKAYLTYRDMAALSLPLIVLVPLGLRIAAAPWAEALVAGGFFVLQYIVTALGARHSGVRFVRNVLAIHSARKVTSSTR